MTSGISILQNTNNCLSKTHRDKTKIYQKLSQAVKRQLAELVYRQNLTIRKASQRLNISYSSAKIILNKFKIKQKLYFAQEMKASVQVSYREIQQKEQRNERGFLVVSLVGGKYETETFIIKEF